MTRIAFVIALNLVAAPHFASASNPQNHSETVEFVDLIELNHHYDKCGRHSYDQVIFYEWSPQFRRFHVIAWCLVETDDPRLPVRIPGSQEYLVRWRDRDKALGRKVIAPLFRETWSEVDPERANKKLLDEKYRLSLHTTNPRGLIQRSGPQVALR